MIKRLGRYLFALLFIIAGFGHFFLTDFFVGAMPDWVPFREAIVYISGLIEWILAIGLLYSRTMKLTSILTAVYLVLIFPVNIYMAFTADLYSIPAYILWIRLPLQIVLIAWVLLVSKDE